MIRERVNVLTIQTPEGIAFSLPLAGPVTRFLAWVIDLGVEAVILYALSLAASMLGLFSLIFTFVSPEWAAALMTTAAFVVTIGYSMLLEWLWRGQTIGKRVLRLRVVDERGLRLQFSQLAIRNLLRVVDILPALYAVGGIACLLSRHSQRLGDFAANTVVIRMPKTSEPDLDQVTLGKYNSLRDYPHLAARLRQRITPVETRLALQAVLRRDALDPQARIEVFQVIADRFRSLATFPEEATLGVADEQYVRNVLDVVFRPEGARARDARVPDAAGGAREPNPVE